MVRNKGFTLVELMVTIAVAAIMLSVAIPSFDNMLKNNALSATTRDFIASVEMARMQAISTRQDVRVGPTGSDWKDGWTVDMSAAAVEADTFLEPEQGVSIVRDKGAGDLIFMARGGLRGGAAQFTISHADSSITSRTICVSFLGKVTMGACS